MKMFKLITAMLTGLLVQHVSASPKVVEGLEAPSLVFKAGEKGYPHYRIPTLEVTKKGAILAFAEARFILDDHGQNDIVLKRSLDGGKTWGDLQVIHADKDLVMVNPTPVTLDSGRIMLFYETFPHGWHSRAGKHHKMMPGGFGEHTQKLLVRWSDDDGVTWSKAKQLQKIARKGRNIIQSGSPANGIQLKSGKYKGRVMIPLFLTKRIDDRKRTWENAVLYSDNSGANWKLSSYVPHGEAGAANECTIVETDKGHVVMNARSGKKARAISISKDGGVTWTPYKNSPDLKNRPCNCGILKFSYGAGTGDKSRTFFSYNNSLTRRANGHIALSYDDNQTWPVNKKVVPGLFGYSQLVKVDDQTLGMIFEPFESVREEWSIYFVSVPLTFFEDEN